jgi:hypothetical protein
MLSDTRKTFLAACRAAVRLVEDDVVATRWAAPSALTGYTVGGLAAHLCRAVSTPSGYLDADPEPGASRSVASAAEYFRAALGDHDPLDSDMHLGVRKRSDDMAASGYGEVLDATRAALQSLTGRLEAEPEERLIAVFGGAVMGLDDYLETRIVELAIHADDLGASCPELDGELMPERVWAVARRVVGALAAMRAGDRAFVLGLSRSERAQRPLAF